MTTHLPRQQGPGAHHHVFNQGMTRATHHGLAAQAADFIKQGLAGFDIGNNGRPRIVGQEGTGPQNHQLIRPHDLPLIINHPNAITIAVKSDANVTVFLAARFGATKSDFRELTGRDGGWGSGHLCRHTGEYGLRAGVGSKHS